MIGGHIDGRGVEQESLGQAALFFGNAGETLQFLRIDDGEVEAGFGGVIEEDGVDDFASGGGQTKGDIGDAEDGFDVRDLLLDEAD